MRRQANRTWFVYLTPYHTVRFQALRGLQVSERPLSALGAGEARSLLQVVDDRLDRRSTVIASQLPLERWHGVVEDPTMSDAILDRLVHGAHHIALKGESMRKGRGRRADGPGVSDDTSGVQKA